MQLILLMLTALSLLLALAMGAALWHVWRGERARSAARVALLRAAAGGEVAIPDGGSAGGQDDEPTSGGDMFALADSASSAPGHMAVLGGTALAAAVAIMAGLQLSGGPTAAPGAGAAAEGRPLELLTLEHVPERGGLAISGVARNPDGGSRRSGVLAVVSALDADGREIGSGRAAVGHLVLEPGTESPFVINVAVAGIVSRYRVGFREPDGTVIAHVDRRSSDEPRRDGTLGGGPWVR